MDEMFLSTSYFPDGFPKDPFTGKSGLGVYTLDMNKMRTNTFMHFCSNDQNCGGFKPKGHTGYIP